MLLLLFKTMKHCVVTIGSAENGLFQKRTKQGELRTYFFEKPLKFLGFLFNPGNSTCHTKQSFTPRNSTKLCITPSEILRTKSKTPGNNCISTYCISGHTIPNNSTFLFCRHDWMVLLPYLPRDGDKTLLH